MESLFSPLQTDILNRQRWTTREDPRIATVTYSYTSPETSAFVPVV